MALVGELDAEAADSAELVVAPVEPLSGRQGRDGRQRGREVRIERPRGPFGIVVGAADRLRHDLVDDAPNEQVRRGDLQRLGRAHLLGGVAPEDRGAALGRDHAVDGMLLHQHPIADRDAQRAAAPALPRNDDDDGHVEHGHLAKVVRDGLGDAALLGLDAGKRGRRVHEDDDLAPEFLGEAHHPDRLPVALWPGVPEVPVDLLLGVAALLVPDHADRLPVVVGKARHDGVIVGEAAIAVHLDEIGEHHPHVVEHVGTVRVAGHLHALPRRERRVDLRANRVCPPAQAVDLALALRRGRQHAEGFDLLQQHRHGFFEIQGLGHSV